MSNLCLYWFREVYFFLNASRNVFINDILTVYVASLLKYSSDTRSMVSDILHIRFSLSIMYFVMSVLFIQPVLFHNFHILTCVKLPSTSMMDTLSEVGW